jgi:phosphatidylserine/phosphatidylglycerophosphate/cardiolipin synthase-like enzyme
VLTLIRSARKQLLFQIPYINMKGAEGGFFGDLVEALIDRSQTIDDCRIIMRSGGDLLYNVSQLKRRGMDVNACVRRLANTHTKGMVVDGRQVLVGSHNWSAAGVTLNRDASLVFDDVAVAQYYAEAFVLDWERASELTFDEAPVEEAPRAAAGDAPPPGFVRMTLAEYLEG